MLIQTDAGGVLNLAHAFEFHYDEAKEQLTVWWAFMLPGVGDRGVACLYDNDQRLTYHQVRKRDWTGFQNHNGIGGCRA